MQYHKYISVILLVFLPCIISCQKSEIETDNEETFEIPVSFDLLQAGSLTTKSADIPDGERPMQPAESVRPVFVDQVRLNIYTRPKGDYRNKIEDFAYYKSQNLTAYLDEASGYYAAQGVVSLKKNYEYRVTALAYNTTANEKGLFTVKENELFKDASMKLSDTENYQTPELFFGTPVLESGDTVFWYDEGKKNELLTGWLYRGVAGVELNIDNVPAKVKKIELLADSMHTESHIRWYSDFIGAYSLVKKSTPQGGFVLKSWEKGESDNLDEITVSMIGANLLPVCTTLALRITEEDDAGLDKVYYTLLRVREVGQPRNSDSILKVAPPDDGNGTGIIPDGDGDGENPDPEPPDFSEYEICFKRNNYYRINADYNKLTMQNYIVRVTVNPNWDADVSLTLGEAQ